MHSWPNVRIDTNYMSDDTRLRKRQWGLISWNILAFLHEIKTTWKKGGDALHLPKHISQDLGLVPKRDWYHYSSASKMLIWKLISIYASSSTIYFFPCLSYFNISINTRSKQRRNFGRLNQSQNKLGFLCRTDIVKGYKNGSGRYILICHKAKLF